MIGDAKLAAGGAALPNGKERNKNNVDIESPCRLKENKVPNFGERRHLIFSSLSLCLFFFWLVRLLLCALNGHFRWRGCVRLSLSLHAPSMRRLFILIKYLFYYERSLSLASSSMDSFFLSFCSNRRERKEPCPCTQRFLDVYGYMEALGPASPSVVIFLRRLKGFWGSSFVHRVLCGLFLLCL